MTTSADTIFGLARANFNPGLLEATLDFGSTLATAIEMHAPLIEVKHLLVALSQIPGGLTEKLLTEAHIPPDVFLNAVALNFSGDGTGIMPGSLEELDAGMVELRDLLQSEVDSGAELTERTLLKYTLRLLDSPIREWLKDYGRIDVNRWAAALETKGPVPFSGAAIDLEAFTPGARHVLEILVREGRSLNMERMPTLLLLYALLVKPEGLLEQALRFRQSNVELTRQRIAILFPAHKTPPSVPLELNYSSMEPALISAITEAAAMADKRNSPQISEGDLFASITDNPQNIAAVMARTIDLDVQHILGFAGSFYHEPDLKDEGVAVAGRSRTTSAEKRRRLSPDEISTKISERVTYQDRAIQRIIPYLSFVQIGYKRVGKSAGVFMFCGPSGTGKTLLARTIAEFVYGSSDEVLLFEMGQFKEAHSMSNFVGAPAGYVGFGQGKLTNGLRDNPRRVLLFDEVEKADQTVFDALLGLLDEGRISDPAGPVRDASESIIVLTSNKGATELAGLAGRMSTTRDQDVIGSQLRDILLQFFRPEFLNRIDEIIMFEPFPPEAIADMVRSRIYSEEQRMFQTIGVRLKVTERAIVAVISRTLSVARHQAARGVNHHVDREIIMRAGMYISGLVENPESVSVDFVDEGFTVGQGGS